MSPCRGRPIARLQTSHIQRLLLCSLLLFTSWVEFFISRTESGLGLGVTASAYILWGLCHWKVAGRLGSCLLLWLTGDGDGEMAGLGLGWVLGWVWVGWGLW
jgi:hypothetical protein